MKFTAGETLTIRILDTTLQIKVEDASKSETISAKVEKILSGKSKYHPEQVYEFSRTDIAEA